MQGELERLTDHYQQLSNDEQTRARTKLQSREQVREEMKFELSCIRKNFSGTSSTIRNRKVESTCSMEE